MSETAFVFPGQGSQEPEMVVPFADAWPAVEETIERVADDALRSLLFDADEETLRDPANTQQAVLTTGLAAYDAVRERTDVEPAFVAGHSLGHITAAAAASVLPATEAVSLVAERGRLMAMAEREAGPGTMIAVSLASPEAVEDAVSASDAVSVAGYNSPKQTVISGPERAVREAATAIEETVSRSRTTELDVGSAFHSPVMEPAVEPFEAALDDTPLTDPEVPVVSDVTGEPYRDAAVAREDLRRQLTSPIRWTAVVETLVDNGVDRVVEFPPAGTLSTLTERTSRDIDVIPLTSPAALEEVRTRD